MNILIMIFLLVLPLNQNASLENIKNIENNIVKTIYHMESSGGVNCQTRYEPEFEKRYRNTAIFKKACSRNSSKDVSSSWGCYQIMLMVAWENGYELTGNQLADRSEEVCRHLISKYMEKYGYSTEKQIWNIFKRYNGGSTYADKALVYYKGLSDNGK